MSQKELCTCSTLFFFHRRHKIFMLFFQRHWSPLFFISRSSSFSVIHVNVDIKIKSKERIVFVVVVVLYLKVRVAMRFNAETRGYLKCKISPRLTPMGGHTYGRLRTIFSEPKFLGCIDNEIFLPMVLRYK